MHCGCFQATDSQLCHSCESDLWLRHPTVRLFDLTSTHIQAWTLFDWFPDEDRKVSMLMMSMKGGQLRSAFDFYAKAFISRISLTSLPSNTVLVPCPNLKGRDHSRVLAKAFSKLLGVPIIDALLPVGAPKSQKQKSRAERQRIQFQKTVVLRHKHVIFIDDIVTTGATAIAAQKALGPTVGFEVWCLAHRRQLAADSLI